MSCAQAEIWPMPSDALRCPPMPPRCPPKMVPDALLMPSLEAPRPAPNQLSKAKHVCLTVLVEPPDTPYSSYHIYFWMYHFRFCVESFSHGPLCNLQSHVHYSWSRLSRLWNFSHFACSCHEILISNNWKKPGQAFSNYTYKNRCAKI